ncbi:hypothetical protein KY290_031022 [Solanum tuberosum]|uniref:Non-LTR retroelement reverse transcriptase n=1 Tax=Solanum tuberosum TaxID=4113 RepID=A0ABQ7U9V7_SOLTU|nr:hypothetical protein KY290_031022 [Solanum tuberosum]
MKKEANHRVRAFNSFLKAGRILDNTEQFELIRPYTEKEVKQAMFSIDKNKSPGPDGYGSDFFQAAWGIIGKDVTKAILEFFHIGKLLKQLNATMISLIPKITQKIKQHLWRVDH